MNFCLAVTLILVSLVKDAFAKTTDIPIYAGIYNEYVTGEIENQDRLSLFC